MTQSNAPSSLLPVEKAILAARGHKEFLEVPTETLSSLYPEILLSTSGRRVLERESEEVAELLTLLHVVIANSESWGDLNGHFHSLDMDFIEGENVGDHPLYLFQVYDDEMENFDALIREKTLGAKTMENILEQSEKVCEEILMNSAGVNKNLPSSSAFFGRLSVRLVEGAYMTLVLPKILGYYLPYDDDETEIKAELATNNLVARLRAIVFDENA